MEKLNFVLNACRETGAVDIREKQFWEKQYQMYNNGIRNASMHDYTLVNLSKAKEKEDQK